MLWGASVKHVLAINLELNYYINFTLKVRASKDFLYELHFQSKF